MLLYQETMKRIEKLESEFGVNEHSEEEEEEEECIESEDDDDVLINREMKIPESGRLWRTLVVLWIIIIVIIITIIIIIITIIRADFV